MTGPSTGMVVGLRASGGLSGGVTGSVVEGCVECLGLRQGCACGALRTCHRSLRCLVRCTHRGSITLISVGLRGLRGFSTDLRSGNVITHSRTHVLYNIHSFCHCLIASNCVGSSPARLLPSPRVNRRLPRCLSMRRISVLRTTVSLSG